jgi:hypothetical protein
VHVGGYRAGSVVVAAGIIGVPGTVIIDDTQLFGVPKFRLREQ